MTLLENIQIQKRRILEEHNIPYYTENNHIYADSMESDAKLFEKVVDVTDWSKMQLYYWLGY